MIWAFDVILVLALLGVAAHIIWAREHFQSVVVFITFGLLLSMAWTRLNAPDIAITEAGIGAGLSGVLLMNALGSLSTSRPELSLKIILCLFLPLTGLIGLLLLSAWDAALIGPGVSFEVQNTLPRAAFEYPVTAVLLDFRGFDTWLELGVLLTAVMGVMSVRSGKGKKKSQSPVPPEPVATWVLNVLFPFMILIGGYLLWLGAFAPGGAFQSGVILAAAGVMLWQSGRTCLCRIPFVCLRGLLAAGFSAFLLLAAASLVRSQELLTHPQAKFWILGVEYAATVSIAACLISLVVACGQR
ncbi:MAG: hydrogenase subunit MbhD domain-containing protein, partial [Desulfovermiculus sp.]